MRLTQVYTRRCTLADQPDHIVLRQRFRKIGAFDVLLPELLPHLQPLVQVGLSFRRVALIVHIRLQQHALRCRLHIRRATGTAAHFHRTRLLCLAATPSSVS